MKSGIELIVLLVATSSLALGQTSSSQRIQVNNVEQEIRKLEQERFNAYLQLNASLLDRIMSDDYTSIYANGEVVPKSQEIEGIKSASSSILSSLSANIDEISVRPYESSALLVGRLVIKGKIKLWSEKDINISAAFRYTAIYVKKQGRWQVVASQFTKIENLADK